MPGDFAFSLSPWMAFVTGFIGTDLIHFLDLVAEDLSVAVFSGKGRFADGVHRFFLPFLGGYNDFELDLGLHLQIHFHAADDLFITSLDAASHNLGNSHSVDADGVQSALTSSNFSSLTIASTFIIIIQHLTLLIQAIEAGVCVLAVLGDIQSELLSFGVREAE